MLRDEPTPEIRDLPETWNLRGRAIFVWCGIQFMKCNPSMYSATLSEFTKETLKDGKPNIKPYDAGYAVAVILLYHKHRTGSASNSDKSITKHKPQIAWPPIPPKCNLSGFSCIPIGGYKQVVDSSKQMQEPGRCNFGLCVSLRWPVLRAVDDVTESKTYLQL
jgi:hypothetical protein